MRTHSTMTRSETVNEVLDFLEDKVPYEYWHHVAGTLYLMLDECERAEILSEVVDNHLMKLNKLNEMLRNDHEERDY